LLLPKKQKLKGLLPEYEGVTRFDGTPNGRRWRRIACLLAVLFMAIAAWCVYQQVPGVSLNHTVEKILYVEVPGPERVVCRDKIVEKLVAVNHTVEKMVEKIVHVEVSGPERIVYRDKIVEKFVQINHTVEKMVEVPKSIFVEKNLTEGTVCTCKAGYYSSTTGARV